MSRRYPVALVVALALLCPCLTLSFHLAMITIISGKVGGGKTYFATLAILEHLLKGGVVVTNINLIRSECFKWGLRRGRVFRRSQIRIVDLNKNPDVHALIPFGTPDLPVLVALDEIHLFFNSRDWKATSTHHRDLLSFVSQSRKAGVDLLFIAQSSDTIDSQFREQAEISFFCTNLGKFTGIRSLAMRAQLDRMSGEVLGFKIFWLDSQIFRCYSTLSFLDARMQQMERERVRIPPLKLQRVPFYLSWLRSARSLFRKTKKFIPV